VEHFFDWFGRQPQHDRPWLILGKGPSFAGRSRYDLTGFHLLSLNHAVREQSVALAHMIDLDVVDACGEALVEHAGHVVLPWFPHVRNAVGTRPLAQVVPGHPVLRRLAAEGRLLWYDLSTAPKRHGPGPVVRATHFSAEAAVSLLALAGVRRVRSLGVDGGAVYSREFDDLAERTLLANGHPAFDLQFQGIARTIQSTGVDFAPLDQPSPIQAFILGGERTELADRVLEFSLRQHTSMSLAVTRARSAEDIAAAAQASPYRAVVLRSGSLAFDDLRKLWVRPHRGEMVEVARVASFDAPGPPNLAVVTAGDRQRLGSAAISALNSELSSTGTVADPESAPFPTRVPALPSGWDRRDTWDRSTSFLCYADPARQPWVSLAHPVGHLWVATLIEAIDTGSIPLELVRAEVRAGRVRPSLLDQVERGNPEPLLVSWSSRRRDERFTPAQGRAPASATRLLEAGAMLRALVRQARRQVSAFRRARAAAGT
jgi:hypothetical protein